MRKGRKKYNPSIWTSLGWKFERFKDYIRYRTYDKYHVVNTKLKPDYYDKDTILLHANFAILVDFVEKECAWMNQIFNKDCPKRYRLPRILRKTLFPVIDRESGLAYVDWQRTHDLYRHEEAAHGFDVSDERHEESVNKYRHPWQEIHELYIWWKDVRPTRGDPSDLSGWTEHCEAMRVKYNGELFYFLPCADGSGSTLESNESKEEREHGHKLALLSHEIELSQEKEDEEMLIRLIKSRKCLWT